MKDRQDFPGLLDLYAQNVDNVNAIHLANIYNALAKGVLGAANIAKLQRDKIFKALLENTIDKLQSSSEWFDIRGVAIIAHSLGKLKIPDERFFKEMAKLRKRIAKDADPQSLSNIVWACATIGWKSVHLFEAVAGEYERIAKDGKPQELSNIVWAFAKLSCKANALFEAVAGQHGRISKTGDVQHMSNICSAFAKAEHRAHALFEAVASQHERITGSGKVQEMSNICWAFATAGQKADALFEGVAGQFKLIAGSGHVQAMSIICWAFAKAGHRAEAFFEAVAGQHGQIAGGGDVQHMSNICWAFATAGHNAEALFKAVGGQHGRITRDGTEQTVVTTLWSFAIAGYLDEGRDLVEKLWKRACDGGLLFKGESLGQLALFYAAAQIEGEGLVLERLPEVLLGQLEAAAANSDVIVSREQKFISSTLTKLSIGHEMEVSPFESSNVSFNTSTMLNIDFVISSENENNKKVAIEFNGPSHYVRCNGLDVEDGTTKFKRRLLEKLNFTVVSIHWDDWRKASDANTHLEFLLNLQLTKGNHF